MIDFAEINEDAERIRNLHALSDGPKRRVHFRNAFGERTCEPMGQRRVTDIVTKFWLHVTCENCKRWRRSL
jgi:hypothetical protein